MSRPARVSEISVRTSGVRGPTLGLKEPVDLDGGETGNDLLGPGVLFGGGGDVGVGGRDEVGR